jgi:hypothetical protein
MTEKKCGKRKVRILGKINLMETSAVGIPAYPYAHASADTSLVKTFKAKFIQKDEQISDELNKEEEETMNDSEDSNPEKKVDEAKVEVKTPTETPETEKAPENTDMTSTVAKAIKEGFDELKEALVAKDRGLVDNSKTPAHEKSLGEMLMEKTITEQGLSKK